MKGQELTAQVAQQVFTPAMYQNPENLPHLPRYMFFSNPL